jgi:hypothetical protein
MYKILFGTESIYLQDGEEIIKGDRLHDIIENLTVGVYKIGKEEILEKVPVGKAKSKVVKIENFYVVEKENK